MSKRDLKKYVSSLDKNQLEEQLLELYDKFKDVKVYYDFVFNPREEKLVADAKQKIANEYFPIKNKRPKLRRSVPQKIIKHYISLGVDPIALADLMFFTIETAMLYSGKREMKYESFYKSIFTAFEQAVHFTITNGLMSENRTRINAINQEATNQKWQNSYLFADLTENVNV